MGQKHREVFTQFPNKPPHRQRSPIRICGWKRHWETLSVSSSFLNVPHTQKVTSVHAVNKSDVIQMLLLKAISE